MKLKTGERGYKTACDEAKCSGVNTPTIYYSHDLGFYVESYTHRAQNEDILIGKQYKVLNDTPQSGTDWSQPGTRSAYKEIKESIELDQEEDTTPTGSTQEEIQDQLEEQNKQSESQLVQHKQKKEKEEQEEYDIALQSASSWPKEYQ